MRELRTGRTDLVRPGGRPADPARAFARHHLFYEQSDRWFSRYWQAVHVIGQLEGDDAARAAIRRSGFTAGGLNAAALEREAELAVFRYVTRPDGETG